MTISELIEHLEEIKNDHGDLDVVIQNRKFLGVKHEYDGFIDPITEDLSISRIENSDEISGNSEVLVL